MCAIFSINKIDHLKHYFATVHMYVFVSGTAYGLAVNKQDYFLICQINVLVSMIMFPLPFIMQSSKIQFTKGISCREEYYFSIYSPG